MDKYVEVEDEAAKPKVPATLASDDLTDWIMTFEGDLDTAKTHAIEKVAKDEGAAVVGCGADQRGRQTIRIE